MSATRDEPDTVIDPGLCKTCRHAETIRGAHSIFWLCGLSRVDPTFPRYPRLPVEHCCGYEPSGGCDNAHPRYDISGK